MAEISSPDYPDERLVVCKNPLLAAERQRKRDELLALTEADLRKLQTRVSREKNPLRGAAEIGKAAGAVLGKRKMAKHFEVTITDDAFGFARKTAAVAEEARFDGFYVLRTSLPAGQVDAAGTVRAYKSLAPVERAFRCMKTVDLELRPVFHWTAPRVRAHVLLCMLAYYLEWHMRRPLAPMLFDDHDGAAAEARACRRWPRPRSPRRHTGRRSTQRDPATASPTGAQLPHTAGRPGDTDPQHRLLRREEPRHRHGEADRRAEQGAPTAGSGTRCDVGSAQIMICALSTGCVF